MNEIYLSILIPAYNFPDGISKIINVLNNANLEHVEVIVCDDSSDSEVEFAIKSSSLYSSNGIRYCKNNFRLGAIRNWNGLISMANGHYIWLLHHDECPFSGHDIDCIVNNIKDHQSDIYILECYVELFWFDYLRLHVPRWQQQLFSYFNNTYLFYRNYYGSPSSFVVRRNICPFFDESLSLLVDIDWYLSILLAPHLNIRYCNDVRVQSIYNQETSITHSLRHNFSQLKKQELNFILKKYNINIFSIYFLSYFEKVIWIFMKLFSIFTVKLTRSSSS